jgi:hypothetical protein
MSDVELSPRQDRHELPAASDLRPHATTCSCATRLLTDRGVNEFLTSNLPNYNNQELDYNQPLSPFAAWPPT